MYCRLSCRDPLLPLDPPAPSLSWVLALMQLTAVLYICMYACGTAAHAHWYYSTS